VAAQKWGERLRNMRMVGKRGSHVTALFPGGRFNHSAYRDGAARNVGSVVGKAAFRTKSAVSEA